MVSGKHSCPLGVTASPCRLPQAHRRPSLHHSHRRQRRERHRAHRWLCSAQLCPDLRLLRPRDLHSGRVELDIRGTTHVLDVEAGDTILQTALDHGVQLSHDCKMGVCMTCPAKLVRLQLGDG